ncbi:MAG TPA: BLUF domain-containing protein [bacterium]|nr:BLUF domain-containing protein [bacterium]
MAQLKRIKYISEFAHLMTPGDIDELVRNAALKNKELDITGILIASGHMFFQVIEGPGRHIDDLYEAIKNDTRHTNMHLLNSEWGVTTRMFPDWSMKRINLDSESTARMEPLKAILEVIMESRCRVERLTGVLERAIWEKFADAI